VVSSAIVQQRRVRQPLERSVEAVAVSFNGIASKNSSGTVDPE
jgi:hypothetical protein